MSATEKFTGRAGFYGSYRPSYPAALVDYLYGEAGFSASSIIADIGAGTGIFSRLLLERGSRVICVEPNGDMRAEAAKALAEFANCEFVSAPAERTGLADASVDFVTVAQAFHWFDENAFKLECRRILMRGGKVALLWNMRGEVDEINREIARLNEKYSPQFVGPSGGVTFEEDVFLDFFRDGKRDYHEFRNDLVTDEETFIGRALSTSYAPRPDSPDCGVYIAGLREIFARHAESGTLIQRNATKLYIGEV